MWGSWWRTELRCLAKAFYFMYKLSPFAGGEHRGGLLSGNTGRGNEVYGRRACVRTCECVVCSGKLLVWMRASLHMRKRQSRTVRLRARCHMVRVSNCQYAARGTNDIADSFEKPVCIPNEMQTSKHTRRSINTASTHRCTQSIRLAFLA